MIRSLIALVLSTAGASHALAQDAGDCRNGLFADQPTFATATVGGRDRLYFLEDREGCPGAGQACRTRSYLVPGDSVVISSIYNGFACGFFPNATGGTAGWLDTRFLLLDRRDTGQPRSAWLGAWQGSGGADLRFDAKLDALDVSGTAFWPGPPGTHDYPTIHFGEIAGPVETTGHTGSYRDADDCAVRFTLLGDFLVASDNRRCGGANVTFSGVYTRAP